MPVSPRLAALPFDLFRHEVLTTLHPVPDSTITEILDQVVLPLLHYRPTRPPAAP